MKIAIDVQSTLGNKTGIGYYTANLVKHLLRIDKENEYSLFSNGGGELRTHERILWEQLHLPIKTSLSRIDLLHSPGFSPPIMHPHKLVCTVHDLIGIIFPENLGTVSRFYWSKLLPFAVSKADVIIADSENTKNDIVKYLNVKPDDIRVIYLAVDDAFEVVQNTSLLKDVRLKYNIPSEFILSVGTVEPRKNFNRLAVAFKKLKDKTSLPHTMVIAGKKGWAYNGVREQMNKLGIEDDIIFLDYIDDDDLTLMYNAASLFIMPSLYEGFGLPVLEAMACGTPVVASNVSSIPEVLEDAGILVDPYDTDSICDAMLSVLTDDKLQDELRVKGIKRAAFFSWEKTARSVLSEYETLMAC